MPQRPRFIGLSVLIMTSSRSSDLTSVFGFDIASDSNDDSIAGQWGENYNIGPRRWAVFLINQRIKKKKN
ncbi:hypothetical protein I7I48_01411 [Histoplasma ohiense]|nr:hypothetical protein I7I48_01411 [Histoplasma ohiense (nom. inval.)]